MAKYNLSVKIVLVICFIAFYLQERYAIFSIDDWTYAFVVQDDYHNYQSVTDDHVIRKPVTSIYDAFISQSRDYFKTNGRFLIHALVQYICGTKTMGQFIVLNTVMFSFFILLLLRLINHHLNIWNLLIILSSFWILFPHKGMTFMGNITCSIDYLWSSVVTLLFIYIIEKITKYNNSYHSLTLYSIIFFSLIAGSLQESFSIGICGTLLIYILLYRHSIDHQLLTIFIAYMIGTVICMITPANFRRFDDIEGMGFHINSLLGLLSSPPFVIFTITIIVFAIRKKLVSVIKDHFLIIIPIFINVLFVIFIAYNGRHQLTAINVFSFIFIFRVYNKYFSFKYMKVFVCMMTSLAIMMYMIVLDMRKSYYQSYMMIIERAQHTNNGIVSGAEFENNTAFIKNNRILECNYISIFTFQDWDFFEKSLSVYLTKGKSNTYIKEVKK